MNYIDVKNFRKYEQLFGDNGPAKIGHVNAVIKSLNEEISGLSSIYAPINSPIFTGTVVLPATTSIGNVSSTEIGYLDGVTSAIQTQFGNKLDKYNGATYDINALVSLSAAEYALITPDPTTIYFVI